VKYFTVSGIPVVVPAPQPLPVPAATIFWAFNNIAAFFYSLYLTTLGWVWPFWYVAEPFYGLSSLFNTLAVAFSDFCDRVNNLISQVANVLSWDTIWSYIVSRIPNLEAIRDWFYSLDSNILAIIISWWLATNVTVQGWIAAATQPFIYVVTAWSNFWNYTWPQLVAGIDNLRAYWDYFWGVTLPTLVSNSGLTTWWNSRLQDVQGLIDSAFSARAGLWSGWQDMRTKVAEFFGNPVQYIWTRFIDWFLGPEG
jgi:hypothetical protein